MSKEPKPTDSSENIHISIPTRPVSNFVLAVFKDRATWMILAVAAWGSTDALFKVHNATTNARTEEAVTTTEAAVKKTQTIVEHEATPAVKEVAEKLENGLADRIANKVTSKIDAKLDPIIKRLEAIEHFLLGDGASVVPNPNVTTNPTTLARPAGG